MKRCAVAPACEVELFYAARKRAEAAGDLKALQWFRLVETNDQGYFHVVDGQNKGSGTALHQAAADQALEALRRLLELTHAPSLGRARGY